MVLACGKGDFVGDATDRRAIVRIAVLGATILAAAPVTAFQINPLKNRYHGDRPPGGFWENISETVHEDITDAARRCLGDGRVAPPGPVAVPITCPIETTVPIRPSTGNKYDPLIRGVWWNDDPNQHLFGVHYATWVLWMRDAKGIATKGRNWLGGRTLIGPGYKMQYRGHYGDLQFLHAMANADGDAAKDVQARTIEWIEFAYAVATEQVGPDTLLGDLRLPAARNFTRQSGWSVHYLFAPKFTLGQASIKEVALGSILHVVQDSYSRAHADRSYGPSARCPNGRIVEFHAYGHQDSDRHNVADTRASWQGNSDYRPDNSPVQASAQILRFARERADWETVVKPYLLERLFCIDDDARASSPGDIGMNQNRHT